MRSAQHSALKGFEEFSRLCRLKTKVGPSLNVGATVNDGARVENRNDSVKM